jgi:hypothetical protein
MQVTLHALSIVSFADSSQNLFNANLTIPELNIPSLSNLENVQIPTGFEDSLVRLNSTLPSLSEIQDKMAEIMAIPFDRLKAEINETRIELAASLNTSILPTPALASLSRQHAMDMERELCSDLDTSVIDDTAKALHKMSTVAIGLMFLMLFFCWAVLCVWEWRRYRAMQQAAEEIEREWREEKTMDVYRVVAIVENPVLEHYGSKILERVAPNERARLNLRWYSESLHISSVSPSLNFDSVLPRTPHLSGATLRPRARFCHASISDPCPQRNQGIRSR